MTKLTPATSSSPLKARRLSHWLTLLTVSSSLLAANALAQLKLTGEIQQGGLIVGQTSPGSKVMLGKQSIKVSPQGHFAFGFGRDDDKTYQLVVTEPSGEITKRSLSPKKREYDIQRIEGIARKIMNPDPKALKRIRQDNAQVATARKADSAVNGFAKGFIAPRNSRITGVYGSQRVFNGVPKRPHFGIDYAGKVGEPVKAPADGVVTLYVPDMFYSGGTMIIDHGHGISSTFLHLSKSYVKAGDKVTKGDVIAAVGKSGRATGPHLDWRVNWFSTRLDPALALKVTGF